MKNTFLPLLTITFGLLVPAQLTHAAVIEWSGDSSTTFSSGANWVGGIAPANSSVTDIASFSGTPVRNPNLTAARSINGLRFNSGNWNLNGAANLLTIGGSGITNGASSFNNLNTDVSLNGAQTWNIGTGGFLTVTRGVSTSSSLLTKAGPGTLRLSSTTTGSFAPNGVNISGGTLQLLNVSDVIADTVNMSGFNNSTFDLNGQSETLGTLSVLNSAGFTINFGSTAVANSLAFAASHLSLWDGTLTILNFQAGDTLRFGTSSAGLTSAQLGQIQFGAGPSGAQIDSFGYVTAIPEPTTTALLVGSLLGLVVFHFHRRHRRSIKG